MSSGRSILVAPTRSAASRVKTSTSATLMPGTFETPRSTSGSHVPEPSNAPSEGRPPVPSISAAGLSPVNFATNRSPSASSVLLWARAARVESRRIRLDETNL